MDDFWKAALKASGPVAVVGFLLWWFIQKAFEAQLIETFGSERQFAFVMVIVGGLFICLWSAIKSFGKQPDDKRRIANKAIFNKSTVKGDVVLGDKNVEIRDRNGE
jgi:hypothetical protein